MTMENIKNGFQKCGIYPYNPNAIDRSQLPRDTEDQLIDLSLPNSEENEADAPLHQADAPRHRTDFTESLPDLAPVTQVFNSQLDEDLFQLSPSHNDDISLINLGGNLMEIDDNEESLIPCSLSLSTL